MKSTRRLILRFALLALFIGATVAAADPGALTRGREVPGAEADHLAPGGISALPSAAPAVPGVTDQLVPAIIPASGPGNEALITAFLDPSVTGGTSGVIGDADDDGDAEVTFDVVDLVTGEPGPADAFFVASGGDYLACLDGTACDLTAAQDGVVVVKLSGGGQQELLRVTSEDEFGDQRAVTVIAVETIMAVPSVLQPYAFDLFDAGIVSYRCVDVGRSVFSLGGAGDVETLEAMWNSIYGGSIPEVTNFFRCGGETVTTADDSVQFETDRGTLSLEPVLSAIGGAPPFPFPMSCDEGALVAVEDNAIDLSPGGLHSCDLDGAPNGVVAYAVTRGIDTGVATIAAGQEAVGAPTRQVNVTFVGPPAFLLFVSSLELTDLETSPLMVLVVDDGGRPVAGVLVQCETDPPDAAFELVPDNTTTDSSGIAQMSIVPTGLPWASFTITCLLTEFAGVEPVSGVVSLDSDGDGCSVEEEEALGSVFDPEAWYDVYDVPVPAYPDPRPNGPKNKVVGIGDVLAVLFYVFADPSGECGDNENANGVDYDCDKGVDTNADTVADVPPDGVADGLGYDRRPGLGPDPVTDIDPAGAPNGVIDIGDVLACLAQVFVVDCSGEP